MAELHTQADWKAETTWIGDLPTPNQIWSMLTDPRLPAPLVEAVAEKAATSRLLQAGLAQSLRERGHSREDIAAEMHRLSGVRRTARTLDGFLGLGTEPADWKVAFANLVSGRFTELIFERTFGVHLVERGLTFLEETSLRSFLDYRIQVPDEGFDLALNLKNAGVQMRQSMQFFGLEPEDTLPIATYKIFGSEGAGIPALVYVYLVDWTLLDRLRNAYWSLLPDNERNVFRMLACTKGIPRDVEDAFINVTVGNRLDQLAHLVGYDAGNIATLPFRAISAAKCRRLFFEKHRRSPYVYVRRMNTDPNVHISVAAETMAFQDFMDRFLSTPEGRARLIEDLSQTEQVTIPAPTI